MRQNSQSSYSWDCPGVSLSIFDHSCIVSILSISALSGSTMTLSPSPYMMFPQSCVSPSFSGNLLSLIPFCFHSVEIASAKMLM